MCDCFFCKAINAYDFQSDNGLAVMRFDDFAVSPGHLEIIPKRHVSTWWETTEDERKAIMELMDTAKQIVDEMHHPDGYNIGMNLGEAAGQSVMHLHVHLIPRYNGDVPNPRGGVRGVIPSKQNY